MKIETIDIADLSHDPANLRKHSERNLDAIVASLRKFGQQHPIIINSQNIVMAGNGRLEAAKRLGWDKIQVVRSNLKGSDATAFSIADNRTAELAEWDQTALAETLRALQSEDFEIESAGFTDDEIGKLIKGLGDAIAGSIVENPEDEWQGMPEFENDQINEVQLVVYFPSVQAKIDFASKVNQPITESTKFVWFPKESKPHRQSVDTMLVINEA